MLDLALCDDEAEQLDIVGRLLRDYVQARPELAIRLSVFSSGRDLLAAEEEGARFDICVLDVVMPELSGIELGIELRERGSASAIIYLTIYPEYAVDSYAAKAFYYLVKPPEPERLYQVLDQAVFIRNGHVILHDSTDNIREREGKSVDELFREMFRMTY